MLLVRATLPSFSVKSIVLSVTVFVCTAGILCFNVFLYQLHKSSIAVTHPLPNDPTLQLQFKRRNYESDAILGLVTTKKTSKKTSKRDRQIGAMKGQDTDVVTVEEQTPTDCTGSGPFNDFHFEPTTNYRESKKLPQWMKDYLDWHREQTLKINKCNYRNYRFLVLRCSNLERKCGGVADRLKSLPFFIAAAAYHNRIFLIRWERPTKLEEFLLPNAINWAAPDYLPYQNGTFIPTGNKIEDGLKRYTDVVMIEGLIQDFFGGSALYYKYDTAMDDTKTYDKEYAKKYTDMTGWHDYEEIFRDLFFSVFEPSPPVAKLVRDKMESQNMVPGKYSTSQYRAFYAIENKKHTRDDDILIKNTKNALNCASKLQPGYPIFFASDSKLAVVTARKMDEEYKDRHIITFDDEQEALHLDKRDQWKSGNVADFYPTFVDLLIMAEAKCMSLGVGGFGRFANILSEDPKCVIRHDSERIKLIEKCKWHNENIDNVDW